MKWELLKSDHPNISNFYYKLVLREFEFYFFSKNNQLKIWSYPLEMILLMIFSFQFSIF